MSRSVWIVLLLLAIWIFLGCYFWYHTPFWMNKNSNAEPCAVSWDLSAGGKQIAKSDATINFKKSTADISNLDSNMKDAIASISKHLKENKNSKLTVIGYHDVSESYEPSLYDLSIARANKVKAMLTQNGVSANQLHVLAKQYKDEDDSRCINDGLLNRGASFAMGIVTK